jgi:hypothetical protein
MACQFTFTERFQKHYKTLTPNEKKHVHYQHDAHVFMFKSSRRLPIS